MDRIKSDRVLLAMKSGVVTNAPPANPTVITTNRPHELVTGDTVKTVSIGGNTSANTTAAVTVITPTTFSIAVDTSGGSAYTSGGTWKTVINATYNTADISSLTAVGALVIVDFTLTPNNAETVSVGIQAKDPTSGKYKLLSNNGNLTASVLGAAPTTETYLYTLYPSAAETSAVANHIPQSLALPRTWRVLMTHSSTGEWAYTIAFCTLL